jgi:hypothetical protein
VVDALNLPLQSRKQITQQDATDILQIFILPSDLLQQFQVFRITTIGCVRVVDQQERIDWRDDNVDPLPYTHELLDITGGQKEYQFDYDEKDTDDKYNCPDQIDGEEKHKHVFKYRISPQGNYLAIQLKRVVVDRSTFKESKNRVKFAIKKRLTHQDQDQNVHFKFFMAAIQEGNDSSQGHWTTVRVQADGSMIYSDNHQLLIISWKSQPIHSYTISKRE